MNAQSIYDTPEGVERYIAKAKGYDGRAHVERLNELLSPGSRVLELGTGPGVDLDLLAETFDVVGSDLSQAFLDRYASTHPDTDLLRLDAVSIDTERVFDAIYSNKVLHHLTIEEMTRSLERQAAIIGPDGLLLHGLWTGTTAEERRGLHYQFYTPATLAAAVPPGIELLECTPYRELNSGDSATDEDDSIQVILRRRQNSVF